MILKKSYRLNLKILPSSSFELDRSFLLPSFKVRLKSKSVLSVLLPAFSGEEKDVSDSPS